MNRFRSHLSRPERFFLSALAILLPPVLAVGCSQPAQQAETDTPDTVRAVVLPYLTHVPMHIAQEEGFFAAQNLDVEFVHVGRQPDVMTALARRDVDAASGMLTVNEFNLIASGARIRMIAALGKLDPDPCSFTSFIARREHVENEALSDPERLRRMKVDANLMMPFGYFFDEALRPAGVTLDDLDWIDLPSPAAVEAMANGTIDLTLTSEPFLQMHLADPDQVVWMDVGEMLPEYVITMLMFGPRLLDDRPDIGERFTVAVLQAIRQYNRGKTPRNLEIVERATGLTPEQVRAACWAPMTDEARLHPEVFRGYQQWNVDHELVERVLEDEELFDQRFIDHANGVLSE
jgi:NitT/TauT family transport system substrate-binding protein